jgi:uncharacterized phage protein (TIGR02216 family)
MSRIAWPQLMRLGLTELRLSPEVFWALTPIELMLLTGQGVLEPPLTRRSLLELASRFPDRTAGAQMELDLR